MHVVSRRARVFDHARVLPRLAVAPKRMLPSPLCKQGQHTVRQFSRLNSPAHRCLYLRFAVRLATHPQDSRSRIESLLILPWELFHPQHAGLSRRTRIPAEPYLPVQVSSV